MSNSITISKTCNIPAPNQYVQMLSQEYWNWAYDEERAPHHRGKWREHLDRANETPIDLEIGTGNGFHFAHRSWSHPERILLGIEIKYKPLIQTIRRSLGGGALNSRVIRYRAERIEDLFAHEELNDVYIHFPDPWKKRRQQRKRYLSADFFAALFALQRNHSIVEIKTDDRSYFQWIYNQIQNGPHKLMDLSENLHGEREGLFKTHFEKIFIRQGLPIHYLKLKKEETSESAICTT